MCRTKFSTLELAAAVIELGEVKRVVKFLVCAVRNSGSGSDLKLSLETGQKS